MATTLKSRPMFFFFILWRVGLVVGRIFGFLMLVEAQEHCTSMYEGLLAWRVGEFS